MQRPRAEGGERVAGLVADAHVHSSLAAIRALGRRGLRVVAMAKRRRAIGFWSRYTASRWLSPAPWGDPDGFLAALGRAADREGRFVVFSCREATLDALLHGRARLPPQAIVPYPDAAAVQPLRDKRMLPELASRSGLGVPATLAEVSAAELEHVGSPVPCAIKAVDPTSTFTDTQFATSKDELQGLLQIFPPDEELLVQDFVKGRRLGLGLVIDRDGRLVASFQQEVLRTWPAGGPTTRAIGVEPDRRLVDSATEILREVGYWGLAQLDILVGRDRPYLLDVNTRLYDSLPLAVASGANLPWVWHAVACGQQLPPAGPYRTGLTYRWLRKEMRAAKNGSPGLLLYRTPAPRAGNVWAIDDPIPSILAATEPGIEMVRDHVRLWRRVGG